MNTGHPYDYEGDLLRRYPPGKPMSHDEVQITQHERNEAAMQRHWAEMARIAAR